MPFPFTILIEGEEILLKIIKKVLIKQVITEKSRRHLKTTFQERKRKLEQECQQLLFEQRKLQRRSSFSKQEIARRFQKEIDKRKEQMTLIDFKIEQLDMLDIGSEITETEVDALIEVKEGSNWQDVIGPKSIVIKDNIVVRIDE